MPAGLAPRFVPRWTRATFFGWMLGFVLVLAFILPMELVGLGATQFPVGLGMGLGVGICQARPTLLPVSSRRAWIAASALCMALPFLVFDLTAWLRGPIEFSLGLSVLVGSALLGVAQARLLRGSSARAFWWIPAAILGWSLAGATAMNNLFLSGIPGLAGALTFVGVVLTGGVALGYVEGVTLKRILSGPGEHAGRRRLANRSMSS